MGDCEHAQASPSRASAVTSLQLPQEGMAALRQQRRLL